LRPASSTGVTPAKACVAAAQTQPPAGSARVLAVQRRIDEGDAALGQLTSLCLRAGRVTGRQVDDRRACRGRRPHLECSRVGHKHEFNPCRRTSTTSMPAARACRATAAANALRPTKPTVCLLLSCMAQASCST
jgi:hypothetical protein